MARRRLRSDEYATDCVLTQPGQLGSLSEESFFKIMLGEGFPVVMYLPPTFARRLVHLDGQGILMEDSSGKQWAVTLKSVGGSLAFTLGWHMFVLDHDIKEGEFLVFKYIKDRHFVVAIYGISGCERKDFTSQRNKKPMAETFLGIEIVHDRLHGENTNAKKAKYGKQLPMVQFKEPCMLVRDVPSERDNKRFLLDLSRFEMEKETESNALRDTENINRLFPEIFPREDVSALPTKKSFTSIGKALKGALKKCNAETAPKAQICRISEVSRDKPEEDVNLRAPTGIACEQYETADYDFQLFEVDVKPQNSWNKVTAASAMEGDHTTVILECSGMENINTLVQHDVNLEFNEPSVETIHPVLQPQVESRDLHTEVSYFEIKKEKLDKKPFFSGSTHTRHPSGGGDQKLMNRSEDDQVRENAYAQPKQHRKQKDRMLPSVVKTEPRQRFSSCNSSFSAVVKSLFFMEIPPWVNRKKKKTVNTGRVVYLKDPGGRTWAVMQLSFPTLTALTFNWDKFCRQNLIQPGDVCHFRLDEDEDEVYAIEITPSHL